MRVFYSDTDFRMAYLQSVQYECILHWACNSRCNSGSEATEMNSSHAGQ